MKTVNLPNLNDTVLKALNFFIKHKTPRFNQKMLRLPIVVGSGNAYHTGQIIFSGRPVIMANESNFKKISASYKNLIKNKTIDGAVIISASGEKDSVWETKLSKKLGLATILLTCSPDSTAAQFADQTIIYPKLPEPYTYNVSTYLGMILSATGENPNTIKKILQQIRLPKNFSQYQAYSFILPDDAGLVAPMLEIKKHELFGPHVSVRAFSDGEARHAKFVNKWDKELVISFGKNKYFGDAKHRWEINLPKKYSTGLIMALSYYIIGLIQKNKPAYYKKNIADFCQTGPLAYGEEKPFPIIVPGQ